MSSNPPAFASRLCAMNPSEPAHIRVVKPGWFTTVQDLGRYGYQQYGVPVSGAIDQRSFTIANRLVDNRDHDAALKSRSKVRNSSLRTNRSLSSPEPISRRP